MKKHVHLLSIAIMLISATLFLSCEKSTGPSGGTPSGSGSESGSVKKTEDPRSTLNRGILNLDIPAAFLSKSITATTISASNGTKSNVTATAKDRHDIFVSKDNNRATGSYIWSIAQIAHETIESNTWFSFDADGTYIVYDFEEEDWWWGYYYIDSYMEYVIFDAGTDYEEWLSINYIETDGETGESEIYCMLSDGTSIILSSYFVEDWEETTYSATEYEEFLVGKTWVNNFSYVENIEAESNSTMANDNYFDLFALDFRANNVVYVYSAEINYGQFSQGTAVVDTGSYSVQNGVLTYVDDEGSVDLVISSTGDFSGNGEEDYFSMGYQDTDFYLELMFIEQSVFENEFYPIGY